MRHVFLVHSHVCHHVAEAVVRHEGLDARQCVLLTTRGFRASQSDLRQVAVDYTYRPESFPRQRNVFDCRRRLRGLDRLLAQLTDGEPFHLYTPQTSQRYMQLILSSRACAGFSFLEEGLNSYLTREQIDRTHPPVRRHGWDRIGYAGRIGTCRFFESGHTRAFGLAHDSFPGMDGRIVLQDVIPPMGGAPASISDVLVFDALSLHDRVGLESVLGAARRVMKVLRAEGVRTVHYKLHPAQYGSADAAAIESTLAERAPPAARPLGPDVNLEELAAARPSLRFFVNASSVGLYAARLGCPVYTWSHWVTESEPRFASVLAALPAVFRATVPQLREHPDGPPDG